MSALGGSKNKGLSLQRVREDSLQCKRERTRIMGVADTINRRKGQKCRNENVQLNPLLLGAVCAKFPHPSATIQTARCVLFSCACDPKLTVAPTTFAPPSLQTPSGKMAEKDFYNLRLLCAGWHFAITELFLLLSRSLINITSGLVSSDIHPTHRQAFSMSRYWVAWALMATA